MPEITPSECSSDTLSLSDTDLTDNTFETVSNVTQSSDEDQAPETELENPAPDQPERTPEERQRILDTYLSERAKFFKHIKRRTKKFEKKSREDYNRARWGKEPVKPPKPAKAAQRQTGEMNRLASAAANAARTAESSRAFATSSTAMGARLRVVMKGETLAEVKAREKLASKRSEKEKRGDTVRRERKKAEKRALLAEMLSTEEAIAVLQAVEAAHPSSTFGVNLTIGSKGSVPNLRGRAHLPYDIKATADVVVVFAEENSESAILARKAGVQHVGATELFEEIENEEIRPTKVLSTPGLLSAVTQRLGRFLGQRGLMPTTRRGGVGEGAELVKRIQEARGATDWLTDDTGSLQINFGRNNLAKEQMVTNFRTLISSVRATFPVGVVDNEDLLVSRIKRKKPKPTTWFDKVYVASTGGPRIRLNDADSF